MALSDIATGVLQSAIASTLALRTSNPTAFRTAVVTFLKNRFPAATLTAADVASGKIVVLLHLNGYVGIGRHLEDAYGAIKKVAP